MCYKIVDMDENMLENIQYRKGELPVVFQRKSLDDYREGELACHWHPEFQFGLLLKGELEYNLFQDPFSKICRIIKAGDGFFINSKVLHSCRQVTAGTEIFTFGMLPGFFLSPVFGDVYHKIIQPVLQSRVFGFFLSKDESEEAVMLNLFREFQKLRPQDANYELNCMELICRIWNELFKKISVLKDFVSGAHSDIGQAARAYRMLTFIQEHYREPVTVDQIARVGGVSRRECFRCFRSAINQTPIEYLNQFRLSVAAHLLTDEDQPVACVSESCGFENISYFTKLFKRRYGVTPSQFRNREKGEEKYD